MEVLVKVLFSYVMMMVVIISVLGNRIFIGVFMILIFFVCDYWVSGSFDCVMWERRFLMEMCIMLVKGFGYRFISSVNVVSMVSIRNL